MSAVIWVQGEKTQGLAAWGEVTQKPASITSKGPQHFTTHASLSLFLPVLLTFSTWFNRSVANFPLTFRRHLNSPYCQFSVFPDTPFQVCSPMSSFRPSALSDEKKKKDLVTRWIHHRRRSGRRDRRCRELKQHDITASWNIYKEEQKKGARGCSHGGWHISLRLRVNVLWQLHDVG